MYENIYEKLTKSDIKLFVPAAHDKMVYFDIQNIFLVLLVQRFLNVVFYLQPCDKIFKKSK